MSLTTAEQLEENEQYDKAYEEYKILYSQKPQSIEILERLGHIAMILDKKEEAAEYYGKILELDGTSVLAHEQLMDIYFHTDKYKYYISRGNLHVIQQEFSHAIHDFKKALDRTQDEEEMASTRFVLANLYEQIGKNHTAIDEYIRILDSGMANELIYLKLAQVYIKEDSITSAIGILERALENNLETEAIKENLAQLYLRNNQTDKAREHSKDDLVKVKSFLDEGANQAAYDVLKNLDESYRKNAQYQLLMAQYYFNVKDWEKGLEGVNAFEKLNPNSPLIWQMRALIYEEMGNDFESHINWGKYNISRGNKDIALNEYFSAYQVQNNDLILLRNIAELLEEMGDKNQAAEFWEKIVNLDETNRKALEKLADFKNHIGDSRGEADILEKLYAIDNKNALIIKKLAQVYEKNKNKEKALEFYNKFVSMSPVNADYEQAKTKIAKLENTEMEEDEGLLGKIMGFFSKR